MIELISNAPLSRFTTLKIGGEAQTLCQPAATDELLELVNNLNDKQEPWHIIGGGSNLLISSAGVPGTVIRTTQLINMQSPESEIIQADAGTRLPHLARYAASCGLSGLEFLVGIPGTVGGAVIMNAGAHGSCVANVLQDATIFDAIDNEIRTWSNKDLHFSYRRCALDPKRHIVLSARFHLTPAPVELIEQHTRANEEYRWKTQPIGFANGGSTFTNPTPERSAGWLLDQAGAKNLREGMAAVSAMHANFVVNLGGATSTQATTLMKRMQDCVFTKFSVRLHPEWKTLGHFSAAELEVWSANDV